MKKAKAKAAKRVYGSHIAIPGAISRTSQLQPSPLRSGAPRSKPGIATIEIYTAADKFINRNAKNYAYLEMNHFKTIFKEGLTLQF